MHFRSSEIDDFYMIYCIKETPHTHLVFAFAFSVVGYQVLFGPKGQISELVWKDGVCTSTLTEEQQQRDDCKDKLHL